MLVAISGSQGCGKTTILNKLKEYNYHIIERKTSRSILSDWNVSLQEVNNNPELTIRFQEELSRRKYEDEKEEFYSNTIAFTERTHADVFTYALVSLGKNNLYSKWLDDYYERCMEYNQKYWQVFYLKAGHFSIEHDGVRGSSHHYSRMVDLTMLDITQQMIHNSKLTIIETPSIAQRLSIIRNLSWL
jgi:predicted ATPase